MNEIGEQLKEARKARGYTLDDLQQMTKIQKRYLIAIEEGNYDVMPGKFYARAFIKQYADTVGLNGDQLLEEYNHAVPKAHDDEYAEKVSTSQGRTRSGSKSTGSFMEKVQDHLPTILLILVVAAIAVTIYFALIRTNDPNGNEMISGESESVVVSTAQSESAEEEASSEEAASSSEETETTDEETEQPAEDEAGEPAAGELSIDTLSSTGTTTTYSVTGTEATSTVTLAASGDSWVSIAADGTVIEQGLLTNGDTMDAAVPAGTSSVTTVIGNAPVTSVQINGEAVEYAPEAADIVRQELTFQFSGTE